MHGSMIVSEPPVGAVYPALGPIERYGVFACASLAAPSVDIASTATAMTIRSFAFMSASLSWFACAIRCGETRERRLETGTKRLRVGTDGVRPPRHGCRAARRTSAAARRAAADGGSR